MPQRRLFVSESFTLLQDALVTAVQTLKNADPLAPVTIVAASPLLALRLRRACAWAGAGHFGLRACTLDEFVRRTAEEAMLQEGWRPLPPQAAPLLLKQVLRELEPDNYLVPLAALPGFPRTVLATIADLRHAEVSPQRLREFLHQAPQGEVSRRKLASLTLLYERYLQCLTAQRVYDDALLLEQAIALLASASPSTEPLLLYGFYDFTPLQRRFIAAATRDRNALVFFPWRAGEAYAYATPTFTWFMSLGFHSVSLAADSQEHHHLARLQERIFEEHSLSRVPVARHADHSVLFLSAPGVSAEARELGRVILELVRSRGVRFHEIGIFLRDPASYGQLLLETLQGLGIPCVLYEGLPLSQTLAGKRFLLLCQVLLEDYARARVIEFIGVAEPPFAALLGPLAGAARVAQWEQLSVHACIVKGAQAWRERLARLLEIQPGSEETKTNTLTDQQTSRAFLVFMEGFLSASAPRPGTDSWRGWTNLILGLLRRYTSPTEHTAHLEHTLLHVAEVHSPNEPVSFAEWVNGVTAALNATAIPVDARDTDGVCIGQVLAAYGAPFRVVMIPGLVDGAFPRLARQDPLLLDQERQYVSEFLSCELRQRRSLSDAEQLLFILALQSAREVVVLSYPRAEHGFGPARAPSFYLVRALEALSGAPASFMEVREWERRASLFPSELGPPHEAMDQIEYHLLSARHAVASADPTPLGYLASVSPFFPAALHAVHQRQHVEELTPFDGVIDDERVQAAVQRHLFPAGLRLSASALETYARCPFRFFLTAVLGLAQFEEPEQVLTLQPRDRGALLHAILHDFFARAGEAGWAPFTMDNKPKARQLLYNVADEHCRRFADRGATGLPLLWEIEQEHLHERLLLFLERECEADAAFLPTAFEVQFGADAAEIDGRRLSPLFPSGPVRFRLTTGEEILLRGRIDRIDLAPDQRRARIVDYKTGKPLRGRFAGGTALQLPLYLYAARALWPEKQWESAAYAYVDRRRRVEAPVFTQENWAAYETTLREVVTKLTQSLQAGCFAAAPAECYPCPFPLICRGHARPRARRKQQDPRLEPLRQVRVVE
jgi:RecB family exonuclease/superfamily I DNA/RNA helicase